MLEWFAVPFLSFPAIFAILLEKEKDGKAGAMDHIETLLILSIFGFFLGLLMQFESLLKTGLGLQAAALPIETIISIPGLESFYSIVLFFATIVTYIIAAILAKAVFALKRIIPM